MEHWAKIHFFFFLINTHTRAVCDDDATRRHVTIKNMLNEQQFMSLERAFCSYRSHSVIVKLQQNNKTLLLLCFWLMYILFSLSYYTFGVTDTLRSLFSVPLTTSILTYFKGVQNMDTRRANIYT